MNDATGPLATPRDWVADRAYPWPATASLPDGDEVVACFTVVTINPAHTRDGTRYLRLQLADSHGAVNARIANDVDNIAGMLRPGLYVGVRGHLAVVEQERALDIEQIAPLRVELDDLVLFLPRSARPAERMDAELAALITSIQEPPLQQLLRRMLGASTDVGRGFRLAPAAKQNHHAYLGGLLEHTISVTRVCDLLAAHYGEAIDRDLLVAGALLHDVGKIREIGARSGFPYTDEGKLLGHILLGLQMIAEAAASIPELSTQRLLLLQHLVASHQGRFEWQSPREPRTLEALLLHYADDLDAKLHQAAALVAAVDFGWTAYDRNFGRDFLRHPIPESSRAAIATPLGGVPLPTAPGHGSGGRSARRPDLDNLDLFADGGERRP